MRTKTCVTPLQSLRQHLNAWWLARLGRSDQHLTHQRNVYIVPSAAGWMMACTLLVLLLASINYQLNLGYLLSFLVAGASAASMLRGHANLRGLHFHLARPPAVFAGEAIALLLVRDNPSPRDRLALRVSAKTKGAMASVLEVGAKTSQRLHLTVPPLARGVHALPALEIQSEYPLGLFKVWTVWRPAAPVCVYPAPSHPVPQWPQAYTAPEGSDLPARAQDLQGEDMEGIRPYRPGDAPKRILWKKASLPWVGEGGEGGPVGRALGAPPWLVKTPSPRVAGICWLDLAQAQGQDLEARLSCLCAWVLQAHAQGFAYGLRLPQNKLEPGAGQEHLHRCLEALAQC